MEQILGDELDEKMKTLICRLNEILISDILDSPRDVCLKLLLVILTGIDNLNQNILIEYLMNNNFFDTFVLMLSNPDQAVKSEYGHDVVLLITLLVNYRKNEGNPYVVQLSILADELALNSFGQIISQKLIEFCRQYSMNISDGHSSSWFSSLSNIVGNMFISDDDMDKTSQIR